MSESKHTPEKWESFLEGIFEGDSLIVTISESLKKEKQEQVESLILTAPVMLAELERVEKDLADTVDEIADDDAHEVIATRLESVRAVLAQARGES